MRTSPRVAMLLAGTAAVAGLAFSGAATALAAPAPDGMGFDTACHDGMGFDCGTNTDGMGFD